MAPAATFGVKFTAGVFIWIDFQGEQRGGGEGGSVVTNRVLRGDYRKLTANEAGSLEYYRDFGGLDKSLLWHN